MAVSRFVVPLCFMVFSVFQVGTADMDLTTLSEALNKLRTCSPETQLSLVSDFGSLDKWWPPHINPDACINITLDIADFERVAYNMFKLGYKVFNDSVTVGIEIFNCKSELPDLFEVLECAITQLENSGPMVHSGLEDLKAIIAQTHIDYNNIVKDFKTCIGKPSLLFFSKVLYKIHKLC